MKTNTKLLICILALLLWSGVVKSQNSSQNYTISRTYHNNTATKYTDDVQYYDGLGRAFQYVQKGVTPQGNNLISLQEYDAHGRQSNSWLPIVSTSNYLATETIKSQASGNYGGDTRPYSNPVYESSPMNRIIEQYGPGEAWNNKPVSDSYNSNSSSGNFCCILYKITDGYNLSKEGNYPEGRLHVTQTTNEDLQTVYLFTDKEGRTVLSRMMEASNAHDTYYVYDDFGNLCYVLPPMINDNISPENLNLYAYSYKYDHRNNCVEKRLPGGTTIKYVYDQANKLIFSQDGNQYAKTPKEWSFYLYDKYERMVVQGVCTNTNIETIADSRVITTFTPTNTGIESSGYTASYTLTSPQVQTVNYYDNYQFRSLAGFNDSNLQADTVKSLGLLTGNASYLLNTATKIHSTLYYNSKGELAKTLSNNHLQGGYEKQTTTYDFTGKPLTVQHIHQATGKNTQTELYTYTYDDPAERLTKITHKLNNSAAVTLAENSYDDFGRLKTNKPHGSSINQVTYNYNIRNWLTDIMSNRFTQNLYYNNGQGTACYNGNISSMTWKAGTETTLRGYKFEYDELNRLKQASYGEGTTITGNAHCFTERITEYDKHGNIKGLQRYKDSPFLFDNLADIISFGYRGNRILYVNKVTKTIPAGQTSSVIDEFNSSAGFTYDANGNMITDNSKNITNIQYNILNLPKKVELSNNRSATYLYDAAGVKRQVVHQGGGVSKTTDYCGNVIYENGELTRILTKEGYITLSGTTPIYHYYLKDHLGNNRVVLNQDGSTVEQVNHYYPFGGVFDQTNEDLQAYKFGGKELDKTYGLDLYDYSTRYMEPALGRFTTMDPLAEKYYSISPYAYCANNPMRYVDPTGMDWYSYEEEYIDEDGNTQTRTKYKYIEGVMSNDEMKTGGYKHMGKTHIAGNTYYSIGGAEIKFDVLDPQSMRALSMIKDADRSLLATIDAMEGAGDFWGKYNNAISSGSNVASILSNYMGASKGISGAVGAAGFLISAPGIISDGQALLNGNLKGMALVDAAMNVVSLAGTPGAAIALSYSGSKEIAKGMDFAKRGSEVGIKRYVNSIFSWMGANRLIK